MQHTNIKRHFQSLGFLFILLLLVASLVPVAYADHQPQVPRVPFNVPVPRAPVPVPQADPQPAPVEPAPAQPAGPIVYQLVIQDFSSPSNIYSFGRPVTFLLRVLNTGQTPLSFEDIEISTELTGVDRPLIAGQNGRNAFVIQNQIPAAGVLASGSSFTYRLVHPGFSARNAADVVYPTRYRVSASVTYLASREAREQPANGPRRLPQGIPGFDADRMRRLLPPLPQPVEEIYEQLFAQPVEFRVINILPVNPVVPNPILVPAPVNPAPVEPVVPQLPQQQSHDRDDAEDAIRDAQDAMRRADCLIDVAEDDVRENYGRAEVRETTVRSAKQDLRRVDNLLDDAKGAKRDRNYDLAVDRAEDAENEAEDIVRLLRRYYSCHLVDGGNNYDTRSGRYDNDYDYNYYDNQDSNNDQSSSSGQSNTPDGNDDFLSAEHRQRLLDQLNQANQDTQTQNVPGAEGDQVIDVQRIPLPQEQSKTESPSPSLWDLGNMNSGFMIALAVAGFLLVLVEIVLAVQYFKR